MKKFLSCLVSLAMALSLVGVLAACGGSGSSAAPAGTGDAAQAGGAGTGSGEKSTVVFWHNKTGDEAIVFDNAVAAYNAAQDTYLVEGLSVNDSQKLIVAMSSDDSPDVIDISNLAVLQYQANGLLECLDDFIAADGLDLGEYYEAAIEANSADGGVYALPLTFYSIQMFYNIDLLKAAGYDEPPKTMEEMYEMAVAATVLDDSGNIDVLGYPLFPYASARQELIYGFGGRWWDEDGNLTPESAGNIASLQLNVQYRELYGIDKVTNFIATANTNRYTEQDMFFVGKQLFRLDGSWLPTYMENFGSDVNWGVTQVPGTEANPELRGTARLESDSGAIPKTAKNKEGAWDFLKWLSGYDGAKMISMGTGNLPGLKALANDDELLTVPGFAQYLELMNDDVLSKAIQYPAMADFSEYISFINTALDEVYAGYQTPEDALAELADMSKNLK